MQVELREFQDKATGELDRYVRSHLALARNDRSALGLAAPTGAGKTIMATALVERLLQGTEAEGPREDLTILWLSDNPELNEQTCAKMAMASPFLASRLVTIDAAFDEPVLAAGTIYFLNIQKLAKDGSLTERGERRRNSIWETLSNTIRQKPDNFLLIIDEAHRGTGTTARGKDTIVKGFFQGNERLPAVPVILGITATPERFQDFAKATGRMLREVVVKPDDVRGSGLLKDRIILNYPEHADDIALLRLATTRWQEMRTKWKAWCIDKDADDVEPLLVVQVEDGTKQILSKTDLESIVKTLVDEFGLPISSIGHAMEGGAAIPTSRGRIEYVAPSTISNDSRFQAVIFKTSLSTGWDCPRAEVMVSFRTANDSTSIAQLVGRMVRMPNARHTGEQILDSVHLYLPRYNKESLTAIVKALTVETITKVEVAEPEVICTISPEHRDAKAAIERLSTYSVKSDTPMAGHVVAMAVSRELAIHGIYNDAIRESQEGLLSKVEALATECGQQIAACIETSKHLLVTAVHVVGKTAKAESATSVASSKLGLELQYEAANRRVGEGLCHLLWRRYVKGGQDPSEAKRRVSCIGKCINVDALSTYGRDLALRLRETHASQLESAPELLANIDRRLARAGASVPRAMRLPDSLVITKKHDSYSGHLYEDATANWYGTIGKAEQRVVARATSQDGFECWLRNVPRAPWALAVPYQWDGQPATMYPDFVVVRKVGGIRSVEVWDPHGLHLADALAKMRGLAAYCANHSDQLGKCYSIYPRGSELLAIDLANADMRKLVLDWPADEPVENLYERHGIHL